MRLLLLLSLVVSGACASAPEEPAATGGAEKVVTTLSNDLCREHGVLQTVCARCNPRLAAVFQARGDWCAEHGLAESFCPVCHPERGGRPSLQVSEEQAPAHGTRIRFRSLETARLAGIETAAASAYDQGEQVVAVAEIVYDATRLAHVNPRAAGVLRTLHAEIGSRVQRDAALARIESARVGADESNLRAARAHVEAAQADFERVRELHEKGIVPAKDLLAAKQDMEAAKAEEAATLAALRLAGTEIQDGSYTLRAPIAGIVTQRNATLGELVDEETTLFEIVDPSAVWAELRVPEADLSRVQVGQEVRLQIDGLPERAFHSRIDYIAPALDPRTRTVLARIRLENPAGVLRAHMYGRAFIQVDPRPGTVSVPREALQRARGVSLVFVCLNDSLFETRRVALVTNTASQALLAGGVDVGESVVTTGSYLLKTETLKESIGPGCCEIEEK